MAAPRELYAWMLLGGVAAVTPVATVAQGPVRSYRVEVFFDRRLTDSDSSVSNLQRLARILPPTRGQVVADSAPVAAIIRRYYGFGPSQLDQTFDLIDREIQRLNSIAPGQRLPRGGILLPTLPRWSPPRGYDANDKSLGYSRQLEINRKLLAVDAAFMFAPDLATRPGPEIPGNGKVALTPDWLNSQASQKGAYLTSLRLDSVDASTIERIPQDQRLILEGPFEIMAADITPAAVAAMTNDDNRFELGANESSAIDLAVANRKAQTTLVILDIEWPDAARADSARIWLRAQLNALRSARGLPALADRPLPADLKISSSPHSRAIADAIAPLTRRDAAQAVLVRYLPLVPVRGPDSVLVDLVSTYFLVRRRELTPLAVPSDSLARADAVTALMGRAASIDNPLGVFNSSRTVLDALLFVLDRRAVATRLPYVVNASWILDKPLDLMPTVYDPPKGLIVAAAGNESEDVAAKRRDLPRWSMNSRYVLSVVNYDAKNHRTCESSYLPATSEAIELSRTVGFRGGRKAGPTLPCGTSFSAPRVAWAISLGLAARGQVPNWDLWIDGFWRQIRAASPAVANADPTHPFDLTRFLQP